MKAVKKNLEDAYLKAYDLTPVDIGSACNRSCLRHPFGEDKGNAPPNFGDLRPGRLELYGVPFQIIDDDASAGKSMAMGGGPTGVGTVTMPTGLKTDCLFFFGNRAGMVQ